jgi:hypothetical protein
MASDTSPVAPDVCTKPLTEYGKIRWPDEMAQLDSLLFQLNNDPNSVGSVYIQLERGETIENTKKHILKILKHFRWRDKDFDVGRLIFLVVEGRDQHTTLLNVYPEGAELPRCDKECALFGLARCDKECGLFRGKDFRP